MFGSCFNDQAFALDLLRHPSTSCGTLKPARGVEVPNETEAGLVSLPGECPTARWQELKWSRHLRREEIGCAARRSTAKPAPWSRHGAPRLRCPGPAFPSRTAETELRVHRQWLSSQGPSAGRLRWVVSSCVRRTQASVDINSQPFKSRVGRSTALLLRIVTSTPAASTSGCYESISGCRRGRPSTHRRGRRRKRRPAGRAHRRRGRSERRPGRIAG